MEGKEEGRGQDARRVTDTETGEEKPGGSDEFEGNELIASLQGA